MKQKEVLDHLIAKNGIDWQTTVAIEELAELTKTLTKALRGQGSRKQIIEEMADVEICLAQLKIIYVRYPEEFNAFRRFKIRRLELFYATGELK